MESAQIAHKFGVGTPRGYSSGSKGALDSSPPSKLSSGRIGASSPTANWELCTLDASDVRSYEKRGVAPGAHALDFVVYLDVGECGELSPRWHVARIQ
jgi:hypothetical protein